jgi:hypothetical protein
VAQSLVVVAMVVRMSICLNVRGTSGAGKSYLVRKLLEPHQAAKQTVWAAGRQRPLASIYKISSKRTLVVLGHYETDCGGCDTLPDVATVFQLVQRFYADGHDVLFEGVIISTLANQVIDLWTNFLKRKPKSLLVIGLNTPLDQCIHSINQRRIGKQPPINTIFGDVVKRVEEVDPKNTKQKVKSVAGTMAKFEKAGVPSVWLSREEALARCKKELGL